mgnify:CR=1 FL=1
MARSNHFAWVFEKKMFIMGGETAGAPPDGNLAVDIPYLDLSTLTTGAYFVLEGRKKRFFLIGLL